jgi:outer membrane translocation and assembly module TamA
MGGNKRLRGYPLQYQHGSKSVMFNSELRYYPQLNILKLFEVAGVAFFDAGKAFGEATAKNIEAGWLQSVGVGLRFFSPHAGKASVIHFDLAFPQSDNPDMDNFAIRIEAKRSF